PFTEKRPLESIAGLKRCVSRPEPLLDGIAFCARAGEAPARTVAIATPTPSPAALSLPVFSPVTFAATQAPSRARLPHGDAKLGEDIHVSSSRFDSLAVFVLGIVVLLSSSVARADLPPLDGPWTMSPLTESFTVQQWAGACGAAP